MIRQFHFCKYTAENQKQAQIGICTHTNVSNSIIHNSQKLETT